ncbi:MAG: hypothetical protein HQL20_06230 [Candidatus Omnitrophica bacterium]|nr:hypothetical protein [Candidatus Omnitrophota bacterium]
MFKTFSTLSVLITFVVSSVLGPNCVYAQGLFLPEPGSMVQTSAAFVPLMVKGVTVHPENPLYFDFIVDTGNSGLKPGTADDAAIKEESQKMIEYFLASLTIAEQDQWVNLSPYEKDRILTDELGKTGLGRDMLAQDYLLKQVTASMLYPDNAMGREFWKRVYERAQAEFGASGADIPLDAFNKVWIVADKAAVYVHKDPKKAGQLTAAVTEAHLKVMLESDYLAQSKEAQSVAAQEVSTQNPTGDLAKQIIRSVVIPELEKEVNTGKNFANLRQIYQSVILATWYKRNLKDALLTQFYADRQKTGGIEGAWVKDSQNNIDPKQIWNKYVEAYKKGAFNLIKEDLDPATGELIPRKYFSGGVLAQLGSIAESPKPPLLVGQMAGLGVGVDTPKDAAAAPLQITKHPGFVWPAKETFVSAQMNDSMKVRNQVLFDNGWFMLGVQWESIYSITVYSNKRDVVAFVEYPVDAVVTPADVLAAVMDQAAAPLKVTKFPGIVWPAMDTFVSGMNNDPIVLGDPFYFGNGWRMVGVENGDSLEVLIKNRNTQKAAIVIYASDAVVTPADVLAAVAAVDRAGAVDAGDRVQTLKQRGLALLQLAKRSLGLDRNAPESVDVYSLEVLPDMKSFNRVNEAIKGNNVDLGKGFSIHPIRIADDKLEISLRRRKGLGVRSEIMVVAVYPQSAKPTVREVLGLMGVKDAAGAVAVEEKAFEVVPVVNEKGELTYVFGTSGIRFSWEELMAQNPRIVQGLAEYLKANNVRKVVVGRDTREGNIQNVQQACAILAANGIQVVMLGTDGEGKFSLNGALSTPVIALLTSVYGADGSLNYTASHNPGIDNGLKYSPKDGGAAPKALTDGIQKFINDPKLTMYKTMDYRQAVQAGLIQEVTVTEAIGHYVEYFEQSLRNVKDKKGRTLWDNLVRYIKSTPGMLYYFDSLQGTAGGVMDAVLRRIGEEAGRQDFYTIVHKTPSSKFEEVDGKPNVQNLVNKPVSFGSDGVTIGGSADGDADRVLLLGEKGAAIIADNIMAMGTFFLATMLDLPEHNTVVKTFVTSDLTRAVVEHINALGGRLVLQDTPVGFKYIVDQPRAGKKVLIGGEESYHIGFMSVFEKTWDDAIGGAVMGLVMKSMLADVPGLQDKTLDGYFEYIKRTVLKPGENFVKMPVDTKRTGNKKDDEQMRDAVRALIAKTYKEIDAKKTIADLTVVGVIRGFVSEEFTARGLAIPEIDRIEIEYQGPDPAIPAVRDGIHVIFKTGDRKILRPSGTEPVGKGYVEARIPQNAEPLAAVIRRLTAWAKEKFVAGELDAAGSVSVDVLEADEELVTPSPGWNVFENSRQRNGDDQPETVSEVNQQIADQIGLIIELGKLLQRSPNEKKAAIRKEFETALLNLRSLRLALQRALAFERGGESTEQPGVLEYGKAGRGDSSASAARTQALKVSIGQVEKQLAVLEAKKMAGSSDVSSIAIEALRGQVSALRSALENVNNTNGQPPAVPSRVLALRYDASAAGSNRVQGGVDLNTSKVLNAQGEVVNFKFDPSQVERFRNGDFAGVTAVILSVTPLKGWAPLLGMATPEAAVQAG